MTSISLVIPSFNQARFLEDCLRSVLMQEHPALEILVYDGGSTDGSVEILERYADQLTYWQSQTDGGQAQALADGFNRATGDLLGWVNSDDILLPGALREAQSYSEAHPAAPFFYGDALWIDPDSQIICPKREIDFDWNIFAYGYCYLPQPATFFRKPAYHQSGGVDPTLNCCMDYDLWHKLLRIGQPGHIASFWAGLREHDETKTTRLKDQFRDEEKILRCRYLQCSASTYFVKHLYQRLRRFVIRQRSGMYRPLTVDERQACQSIIR